LIPVPGIARLTIMAPPSKTALRRLYPSITDPSYLVLRSRRLQFAAWAAQLHGKRLAILDVGGRYRPYRPLFESVDRYVAVDPVKSEFIDIIADGQNLPFASATFDVVIATQVFDYFPDPFKAAKEMERVLKPEGVLLGSFPACAPRFVDRELWRFTDAGLRALLEPFEKVEIIPELHSVAGLIRTVNIGLDLFVRYNSARHVYRFTVCPVLNVLGLVLETLKLSSNDQFTPNYSVRAMRAGGA
jgi:SAM-dependent methyltransferase